MTIGPPYSSEIYVPNIVNDSIVSSGDTYSSSKIVSLINGLVLTGSNINDNNTSTVSTWSSTKILTSIGAIPSNQNLMQLLQSEITNRISADQNLAFSDQNLAVSDQHLESEIQILNGYIQNIITRLNNANIP